MDQDQQENQYVSLEDGDTSLESQPIVEPAQETVVADTNVRPIPDAATQTDKPKKLRFNTKWRQVAPRLNVYLLLFVFIVLASAGFTLVSYQRNQRALQNSGLTPAALSPETLDELNGNETKVGDPKQILSIESNTIFSGKVLVRDSLDVAGTIRVGSALNLPGLTVAGTSTFDQIQANRLAVSGDSNLQGLLNVQRNLTVGGGGSFGGPLSAPSLNVQSLQLSGDLQINRHIDAGGGTPGRSNGTALGSGGTASVGGTDTAGTITLNIGGSPAAGCFVTVTFAQRFNDTPHILVTPVGSAAAGLNYYVNRNSTSFSLCTTNPASAGTSFSFDYMAID